MPVWPTDGDVDKEWRGGNQRHQGMGRGNKYWREGLRQGMRSLGSKTNNGACDSKKGKGC